jgi:hypothetical protein
MLMSTITSNVTSSSCADPSAVDLRLIKFRQVAAKTCMRTNSEQKMVELQSKLEKKANKVDEARTYQSRTSHLPYHAVRSTLNAESINQ